MSTPCENMTPLLVRAADGPLPDKDQAVLDRHLATCTACADALAMQRAARVDLAALAAEPVVTHARARVLAQLREEQAAQNASWLDGFNWQRWTWRLAPVALVLAVVAAGTPSVNSSTTTMVTDETSTDTTATDLTGTPLSSALVSGGVGGDTLLSLMLNASPDDAMATLVQGGTQ